MTRALDVANDLSTLQTNNTLSLSNIKLTPSSAPGSPVQGDIYLDSSDNNLKIWTGSFWKSIIDASSVIATGGTVTDITDNGINYKVHTFTTSGTFTVLGDLEEVEYLVVAGGGGGGGSPYNGGAGGGAGGAIVGSAFLTTGSYTVTIGAGAPREYTNQGYNGSNSVFNSLTAIGGGGGGAHPNAVNTGADGGSGGGGTQSGGTGGAGTPGQGNDGASSPGYGQQGGGGGAGAAATSFHGGIGIEWPVGSGNYYAGGGGSEERNAFNNPIGQGGQGGGGNGLDQNGTNSADTLGDANTGGGGGGGAGSGGSGIVIIRYQI